MKRKAEERRATDQPAALESNNAGSYGVAAISHQADYNPHLDGSAPKSWELLRRNPRSFGQRDNYSIWRSQRLRIDHVEVCNSGYAVVEPMETVRELIHH
jgi:hypothetical protein